VAIAVSRGRGLGAALGDEKDGDGEGLGDGLGGTLLGGGRGIGAHRAASSPTIATRPA